jgi:hypothetical protein
MKKYAPRDARLGRLEKHAHGERGDDVGRGAEALCEAGEDLGGGVSGDMIGREGNAQRTCDCDS